MLHFREFGSPSLVLAVTTLGGALLVSPALGDSVPESIRIQQQAEKAYEAHPVVPIERGNAHHRDLGKEDGDGGTGGTYVPVPPPAPERPMHRDSNN